MIEVPSSRERLRAFITTWLIHDADYPLADDETLITGGLIDLASLDELALFIEENYGVHIDEDELTTENIDTLDDIIEMLTSRLE